jgi:hypothetical protein
MAWLVSDKDGKEAIYIKKPERSKNIWYSIPDVYITLPYGSIKKLVGKELFWEDECVEI